MVAPWPLRSRAWSPPSGNLGTTVLAKMFPCTTCNLVLRVTKLLKKVHLLVLLKETQEKVFGEWVSDRGEVKGVMEALRGRYRKLGLIFG